MGLFQCKAARPSPRGARPTAGGVKSSTRHSVEARLGKRPQEHRLLCRQGSGGEARATQVRSAGTDRLSKGRGWGEQTPAAEGPIDPQETTNCTKARTSMTFPEAKLGDVHGEVFGAFSWIRIWFFFWKRNKA